MSDWTQSSYVFSILFFFFLLKCAAWLKCVSYNDASLGKHQLTDPNAYDEWSWARVDVTLLHPDYYNGTWGETRRIHVTFDLDYLEVAYMRPSKPSSLPPQVVNSDRFYIVTSPVLTQTVWAALSHLARETRWGLIYRSLKLETYRNRLDGKYI